MTLTQFLTDAITDPTGPQAQQLRYGAWIAGTAFRGFVRIRAFYQLRAAARPAIATAPEPTAPPLPLPLPPAPAAPTGRPHRTVVVRPARRRTCCCCR
ncbi:hypothetical protein [Kitasatospora sp. NPDC088134]|uniref:hypothetical protein n=1 Tax=Kitasatospora sp. NPDC088134 TaxID=3364071 RepID=UPI0038167232